MILIKDNIVVNSREGERGKYRLLLSLVRFYFALHGITWVLKLLSFFMLYFPAPGHFTVKQDQNEILSYSYDRTTHRTTEQGLDTCI